MPPKKATIPRPKKTGDTLSRFLDILNEVSQKPTIMSQGTSGTKNLPFEGQHVTSIDDELAKKKHLENLDFEQDIELKRKAFSLLFRFLAIETTVVFVFMFLQATTEIGPLLFRLDEWSFRLVIAATITQITLMLTIAVQYLFPKRVV